MAKSTIHRSIKRGIISARPTMDGRGYEIDPAELHRVYPPVAPNSSAEPATERHATAPSNTELEIKLARAEADLDALKQVLEVERRRVIATADHAPSRTAAELVAVAAERVIGDTAMSDTAENAATRLWRDRVQVREQERDEAQAHARLAEAKVTALTAETDRLARENARLSEQSTRLAIEVARLSAQNERLAADIADLRALRAAEASQARTETEQQMEDLKTALLSLLDQSSGSSLH